MVLSAAVPQCTNQSDCTAELQAALDSAAPLVDIAPLPGGRPWIIRPVHLRSNTTVIFRPGVHVQAKRFSFFGITDSLINILGVQNVTVVAHGARFSRWSQTLLACPSLSFRAQPLPIPWVATPSPYPHLPLCRLVSPRSECVNTCSRQ